MKRIILNFLIIVLSVLYGLRTVVNEPFKQLVFDLIYTAIEGPYLNPYEQAVLEQKSDEVRHDISFNDHGSISTSSSMLHASRQKYLLLLIRRYISLLSTQAEISCISFTINLPKL